MQLNMWGLKKLSLVKAEGGVHDGLRRAFVGSATSSLTVLTKHKDLARKLVVRAGIAVLLHVIDSLQDLLKDSTRRHQL